MTLTGLIGRIFMFPLQLIIRACVAMRIHPNILTFVGVIINAAAAWALALGRFATAGVIMVAANIFDFIDGKVALELQEVSEFGGFWDSVWAVFVDIVSVGLILWIASGIYMWWGLPSTRRWGWLALSAGMLCFAVIIATL